jgi:hypothetical protein
MASSDNDDPRLTSGVKAALEAFSKLPNIAPISIPKIDLSRFAKVHEDALAVFPEIQKRFAAQANQFAELQRTLAQIPPATRAFLENAKRLQAALAQLQLPERTQRVFELVARAGRRQEALDRIGLLPHPSTPFALLDDQADDDALKAALEQHYRDNWSDISAEIQERALNFAVDDEAKAALVEALEAHQNGHYRSVCRLLLPEIERVARVELLGNGVGSVRVDKVIGQPAGQLVIGETNPPGLYALGLFKRLTEHLYVKVDEKNRAKLETDPVPNRHAAIHGVVVYNTIWHSLNVIFMTDYTFQVVTALKGAGKP